MQKPEELLSKGETLIDEYDTEIARWKDGSWSGIIPPLNVIVTNFRLVLQLRTRKQHEPAIIPTNYITRTEEFHERNRPGVILYLETGQHIAFFIPHKQREEILRNLHTVTASKKPMPVEIKLDLGSLRKLIDHLSEL